MKCRICNADILEGQTFCPHCGTKVEEQQPVMESTQPLYSQPAESMNAEADPQNEAAAKAAKTGLILGIVSQFICFAGLITGIFGIINSAKGLKCKSRLGMAIPGLILSIEGALAGLIYLIYIPIYIALLLGMGNSFQEFDYLATILKTALPF